MSFNIDKVELEEAGRHWRAIITPEVKDFVKRALDLRGSKKQVEEANKMLDLLLAMLRKRKQIVEGVPQPVWVDVMLAAGLLHNLYYEDTVTSLFMAREKLQPIADACNVPGNAAYSIFQAIECQLGDDTPIESCRPVPSTPNELFAWARWFVHEYSKEVRL